MPDFRVFCTPSTPHAPEITLSPDESHHLVVVNRARTGDTVVAFDGRGNQWTCDLVGDRKNGAVLKVRSKQQSKPLPYEITLAQSLPKGQLMDAIVRKATEIGVRHVIPLESERTQVHLESDRSGRKVEKWQNAALEAAKQCGNPFVPDIAPVQSAATFIAAAADYDLKLVASLHGGAKSLKAVLAAFEAVHGRLPTKVVWVVGPEGDFSPAEMHLAQTNGFEPITLGPLVLRCETAAVYALSILSYELQRQRSGW